MSMQHCIGDKDVANSFANALKEKQSEEGFRTQEQFAKFLGIDQSTLSRIYNDIGPGSSVLRRILARYPALLSHFVEKNTGLD